MASLAEPGPFISTGRLPSPELVRALVDEAYERFRPNAEGENSQVYPALATAPADLFGVCVAGTNGNLYKAGDADVEFPIMSVSKPFVFALVCQALGPDLAQERLGVNGTGLPFNSVEAIERGRAGRTNPMVNPGAIATTSLVPGDTAETKWRVIRDGLSRFAGRELALNDDVFRSETTRRNWNPTGPRESIHSHVRDGLKSLPLLLRRISS